MVLLLGDLIVMGFRFDWWVVEFVSCFLLFLDYWFVFLIFICVFCLRVLIGYFRLGFLDVFV